MTRSRCAPGKSLAIPYRRTAPGRIEVLLITSRKNRDRWILPKGNVKAGLSAQNSAAEEAYEEAGVLGLVSDKALQDRVKGKRPRRSGLSFPAFPLPVDHVADVWPEMDERKRLWVPIEAAIDTVGSPYLRRTLKLFQRMLAVSLA